VDVAQLKQEGSSKAGRLYKVSRIKDLPEHHSGNSRHETNRPGVLRPVPEVMEAGTAGLSPADRQEFDAS